MKLKLLAVAVIAAISTPAFAETKVSAKAGKGIKVKKGDTELSIGGRVMFDVDYFDGDAFSSSNVSGSDTEIRRARLFLKGKFAKDWEAKIQGDFKDSGSTKLADAYVKYKGFDFANVTMGKHKAPFGLEEQTSSKDITAIERTMATNAFAPGRKYGVSVGDASKDMSWAIGLYDFGDDSGQIQTGIVGRLTFAPIAAKNETFHLGIGFNSHNLASNVYKDADQRLEIHTARQKVGSGSIAGQKMTAYNLEIAYASGPFHAQAEYFDGEIDGGGWTADTDLSGYYAQVGYILTGESRPYKKGKFKRVKPKGNAGAWEILGRYSHYAPGNDDATVYTLGLNYYANNAVRLGVNYVMGDLYESATDKDGDAIAFRVQYVF